MEDGITIRFCAAGFFLFLAFFWWVVLILYIFRRFSNIIKLELMYCHSFSSQTEITWCFRKYIKIKWFLEEAFKHWHYRRLATNWVILCVISFRSGFRCDYYYYYFGRCMHEGRCLHRITWRVSFRVRLHSHISVVPFRADTQTKQIGMFFESLKNSHLTKQRQGNATHTQTSITYICFRFFEFTSHSLVNSYHVASVGNRSCARDFVSVFRLPFFFVFYFSWPFFRGIETSTNADSLLINDSLCKWCDK